MGATVGSSAGEIVVVPVGPIVGSLDGMGVVEPGSGCNEGIRVGIDGASGGCDGANAG